VLALVSKKIQINSIAHPEVAPLTKEKERY
jgi:hypothetical protein